MPAAAPIILGAALSGITVTGTLTALTIGFSWTAFAGSLILGGLSSALTPKPKTSGLDTTSLSNEGQTVAVRQPDLTRQIVYGHTRITRGYANMQSTGINGVLHLIVILCEGPIRAINEIWLNDYCIPQDWIDADGNVTQGRYAGKLTLRKHLGIAPQIADAMAVANMPGWNSNCRLDGTAYLYVTMTKDQDVYPTGVPNISAVVEGQHVVDPRTGAMSWSTNMALYANDFIRNDVYGFGAFDDDVDDVNIAAQASICDEIVTCSDKTYTVTAIDAASDILTLNGDLLPYQFGDRVEVASDGSMPTGVSALTSYYVIPYQVKDTPRIQLAASLDNAMAKVAINITGAGSGVISITKTGEPRYHGGGIVDTETSLSQTLSDLVTGMAGRAINVGGFWTLNAGAWRTPDLTLGIGDMRSGIAVKNSASRSESYNVVKGLFSSSLNLYQSSDYPSARYQEFIDQDNGIEAPKELNLVYTNRPTTAQRIAKIELFKGRQDIVFRSDFSTKALQVKPGDNINLDVERFGWDGKEYEVTTFALNVNDGALSTTMTLRETVQEIFDWPAGEAIDYDPAPNTSLPNPFLVQVPSGVSYNSREVGTRDGDVIFTLTLLWDQHPDQFVTQYGDFEVQYRQSTEADWRPSFFVDGALTQTDVVNSSANVAYDVRSRARNNLGVRSNWVNLLAAVVGSSGGVGLTADYLLVTGAVTTSLDYGNVYDAVTASQDWEFVV